MNSKRSNQLVLMTLALSLLVAGVVFSSSARPSTRVGVTLLNSRDLATTRFDEYGNLCWEDEQARLDNFASQLQNSPNISGDIVVYAGRHSCPDEAKYRAERARKWVVKRGVSAERVTVRDGGYRKDVQTVLTLVPSGSEPLSLDPTLNKKEVSIKRRCVDKVFTKVICLKP